MVDINNKTYVNLLTWHNQLQLSSFSIYHTQFLKTHAIVTTNHNKWKNIYMEFELVVCTVRKSQYIYILFSVSTTFG